MQLFQNDSKRLLQAFRFLALILIVAVSGNLHADWPTPANPVTLSPTNNNLAYYPAMAVAPNGNALAVWSNGTTNQVQASHIDTSISQSWTSAVNIAAQSIVFPPVVAINSSGNGIAVWNHQSSIEINASFYNGTTHAWSAPSLVVSDSPTTVFFVGMDSSGNAIVMYGANSTNNACVVRWNGSVWSAPTVLGPAVAGDSYGFAMNENGDAFTVFETGSGATRHLVASKYSVGTNTWSPLVSISQTQNSAFYNNYNCAIDSTGNCLSIWSTQNGPNISIFYSKSDFGSGTWSAYSPVIAVSGPVDACQSVSFDDFGHAMLVMTRSGTTYASRYTYGTNTWSLPILLQTSAGSTIPRVALNAAGDGAAVWYLNNGGTYSMQGSTYSHTTDTWTAALNLTSATGPSATNPSVGIGNNNVARGLWGISQGGFQIVQATQTGLPTDPATSTVTSSPGSVQADGVTTSTITVTLLDSTSTPVVGHTVTLAAGSGSSIISDASGLSDVNGHVTFTVKDSTVENVTYTATDTTNSVTITQTATVQFIARVSSATNSTVTRSPTSVPADGVATSTITVTLLNGNSVPVQGHTVTLAAGSGSSIISAAPGLSNPSGVVTFTVKDSTVENVTYTATDATNGVTIIQTATVQFTALVADPTQSTVQASPATVAADGVSTSTVTVTLKDVNNVAVPGKIVTLTAGSGSSTISPASGPSNASGVVTFSVKDSMVENVTYTAHDTTDSVTITQTVGVSFITPTTSPTLSTSVSSPTNVPSNGTTVSTITVTFLDSAGVPVQGHIGSLTANGGSSIITGPSGPSDVNGQMTFTVTDSVSEVVIYTAFDVTGGVTLSETPTVTFQALNPTPPTYFTGSISLNRFASQNEIQNVLKWGQSSDATTVAYRIYQNGVLVYTAPNTAPFTAVIHNCRKAESYTIVAVNANGLESTPLPLVVQ